MLITRVKRSSRLIINDLDSAIDKLSDYTRGDRSSIKIAVSSYVNYILVDKVFRELYLSYNISHWNVESKNVIGEKYCDCEFVLGYERDFIVVFVDDIYFNDKEEPIKISIYE